MTNGDKLADQGPDTDINKEVLATLKAMLGAQVISYYSSLTKSENLSLAEEAKAFLILMWALNLIQSKMPSRFVSYGPSRHLVIRTEDNSFAGKAYSSPQRYSDDAHNIAGFHKINRERSRLLREITNSDLPYIGLPDYETDVLGGIPVRTFKPIQGELLYYKTIAGTATLEDYIKAAVQITRIQEEGKIHRRRLKLEDVVRSRQAGQPDYFTGRFKDVFFGQLLEFSGIQLSALEQEIMMRNWQVSVAPHLIRAHYNGFNGYYFDGNPRHSIFTPGEGIVSIDFEYKIIVPFLLGLANLMSSGLTTDGKPYISPPDQIKILDRALLEIEFVRALKSGFKDKAARIHRYISERYESGTYDLSGEESDDFYRFVGRDDKGFGIEQRERFLAAWPYALLDRNAAWIGHKARYISFVHELEEAKFGFRDQLKQILAQSNHDSSEIVGMLGDTKFELSNPIQQYAAEQRQHLGQIVDILWQLYESSPNRDSKRYTPLIMLYNAFNKLQQNSYFTKN